MTVPTPPTHQIRALHTDTTVTVYQAYAPSLGLPAAREGRFPPAWKRDRMTWIKPSFLWMMYRCGWATKEGQETVLAVEITREGFDWALSHAELSHYERGIRPDRTTWQRDLRRAPARVQWDPERDLRLNRLPHRSLQLGLSGEAARRYADEWTVEIRDVTPLARRIHELLRTDDQAAATRLLPQEPPYPTPPGTPLPAQGVSSNCRLPGGAMHALPPHRSQTPVRPVTGPGAGTPGART